ncbi:acyl-CoA N-acyltransferase [Gorgonomyces haynaldii]|nr:acyl-CoA N-acyltransferase [Gorgonomyces haynaldii]
MVKKSDKQVQEQELDQAEQERLEITKIRKIERVRFQEFLITTWYYSPYPPEYLVPELSVCHRCFKYFKFPGTLNRHSEKCRLNPPGTLVYEKSQLGIFQLDGKADKLYCQNLCLFAKLFLDHKTIHYDISHFWFYVLTERKGKKHQVVGYFSKEKQSVEGYNLSCILVLPPFQRKGYGRAMIEFSYELSKLENKIGAPERPLSDLGLRGYLSYWQAVLLDVLIGNAHVQLSIRELSLLTSIAQQDIILTLNSMGFLSNWKADNLVVVAPQDLEDFKKTHQVKMDRSIDPTCINWSPSLV